MTIIFSKKLVKTLLGVCTCSFCIFEQVNDGGSLFRFRFCVMFTEKSLPHFTVEPLSVIVRQGSAVKLTCSSQPDDDVTVRWLFNSAPVPSPWSGVHVSGGSLTITPFSASGGTSRSSTPGHEGAYQCVANNSLGSVISRPARVLKAGVFF